MRRVIQRRTVRAGSQGKESPPPMDTARRDGPAQTAAARFTRRVALWAPGLATGLVAASPIRATAQDATPDPLSEDASFLFVQSAASGTFEPNPGAGTASNDGTPVAGGGADYLLTLDGHTGDTVYFSDRPERIFGETPTQQFLTGLGFSPDNPPNAAIVTNDVDGNEDILVVELLEPTYDADAGSITYGVNLLSDYEGGLGFLASRQQDEDLAPSFGSASLFIDDCPTLANCYYTVTKVGPIPGGPIGTCWKWDDASCQPCNGNSTDFYRQLCDDTYPNQCPITQGDEQYGCDVYVA